MDSSLTLHGGSGWDNEPVAERRAMAGRFGLPPPPPLEIHGANVADKWKKFRLAWNSYALATELTKKPEPVQVATLLTIIGEDARDVFSTFDEANNDKIIPVLQKFEGYCQPRKNVPFERYRFNQRAQEAGETYDQYKTALRKLAEGCEFASITPEEILRDRLVFGIRDTKVQERLLRETALTLQKTDEICRASESTALQMKEVSQGDTVSTVNFNRKSRRPRGQVAETSNGVKKTTCGNCGRSHEADHCIARGKTCNECGKMNHFASMCRSKRRGMSTHRSVRVLDEEIDSAADSEDVYTVSDVAAVALDDSQIVTLRLESGNFLRFQADTGAQCNVIPVHLYKKAAQDPDLQHVKPVRAAISAYGGSKLPVVGQVIIRVWRDNHKCLLDCKLVDNDDIRPILGRKACIGMNIIKYIDNDAINKPEGSNATVYAIQEGASKGGMTTESLLRRYPQVFSEDVGELEGEYHIKIDKTMHPVQHAPRKVPVALRNPLKSELDHMVEKDIIAPVTTPTPWVSSLVVVPKKNGKLRLCLDPKDLNKAIQREHYPLPTIEDVATRLHGAKVFTKLDVRNGFWHVRLDEDSSFLTTFNTPFGRYRWKRMPFGIRSAPEVFQRKMHELVEGVPYVEVVADDFVVVGYGETYEQATEDHDRNLTAFLQRCQECGLKLNVDKLKLRQTEVPFIGHVATGEGLRVDPAKVKAICEMPDPTDKAGVQRLLGLAQYLSKFLPHLSDLTKPLRELTQEEVEWCWGDAQAAALSQLKEAVTRTPVLRYYNLNDEVTLQCDASQSGLGAAMLQNGQPVAYASRALTPTETRYAQIEKELLAIVFACEKFDPYIFGRAGITVETDHKPLEAIVHKPLDRAPQRLQRMLLRLQKFDLKIKYKKGQYMFLADTLSRAFLPQVNVSEFTHELEAVNHEECLPVSEARWQQIRHASIDDPTLRELRAVIRGGWPDSRSEVPQCLFPYFDVRDELTVQDELVFKAHQLVVPVALRKELMAATHSSHMGIEACIRRARESLYWPRMSTELKEFVSKCDVCMAHRSAQSKEPIQQHEFVARPWSRVAADLCDHDNRTLLVVSDYFSNFIEVARLTSLSSRAVIKELKAIFARYGIPDALVTDNGPQFSSAEFSVFARTWGFDHVTSSPRYPQSNGKAENAVKTIKNLFRKCKASGQSEFLALLDWRNTPTEGIGTSPAQRLMGRRCKTLLPTAGTLLKPRFDTEGDARALAGAKQRQQFYYNKTAKPLKAIVPGETVRVKLPGQDTWQPGTCSQRLENRSYLVKVGDTAYRRNRRHVLKTNEPPATERPDAVEVSPAPRSDEMTMSSVPGDEPPSTEQARPAPGSHGPSPSNAPHHDGAGPRRSSRHHQKPVWHKDFVVSWRQLTA